MTELALNTIVKAWRDDEYLENLTDAQRSLVPTSPAGELKASYLSSSEMTMEGSTFINNTCSTMISDCCSTMINNTCSTMINDCCGH